jgi:hypothetical protein
MSAISIFVVSASVTHLKHPAILESLEFTALQPGLYEMKIDNASGNPDCHKPQYSVRFEARKPVKAREPIGEFRDWRRPQHQLDDF